MFGGVSAVLCGSCDINHISHSVTYKSAKELLGKGAPWIRPRCARSPAVSAQSRSACSSSLSGKTMYSGLDVVTILEVLASSFERSLPPVGSDC